MLKKALFFLAASYAGAATASSQESDQLCPGYKASNIKEHHSSLTADLTLAGKPCNTYGTDLKDLRLLVEYQTDGRLHVMIHDADEEVYQVPESVLPRPGNEKSKHSALKFNYKEEPFSFSVTRDGEVLFDTSSSNIIFQSQYLSLRTAIPDDPYLYGLGEHSDAFRLESKNYTRTLWNRDSYGTPPHSNLYSSHPVYYDHRGDKGTHGVFLLNSNGMDIKIDEADNGKKYLEYNILGGVFDFYFFNGETPKEASIEYSKIVGLPAMQSYWTFGYHQCKYGYQDVYEVAEVVANYSKAGIPLETMWTDIDYMDKRTVFTLDEERYPLKRVRELVDYLHDHDQHYIVMVDPAVGVSDNEAFKTGLEQGILLQRSNGSLYKGVVWPGVAAFPDWFHPDVQEFWDGQFNGFFDGETGVDIDGLWIDMNEASNFCPYPCEDPEAFAVEAGNPPKPPPVRPGSPRPIPGFPEDFQPRSSKRSLKGKKIGLPGRDLLDPPYKIGHAEGIISNKTINTDIVHAGEGYVEYDTHNIYGSMMSSISRHSMQQRRPDVRPLVITRSTFPGSGTTVGHWLGDNLSIWHRYRVSIPQSLAFASMFQIPMVGADVCGFGANTTEELCSRWARLGAFYTFFRNHNDFNFRPQEFYLWPTVTESAKKAIDLRYRLLDYMYTAFYKQSKTGEPFLQPVFYLYPTDKNTFANEQQFFYGDSLLVSPVMEENATSVDAYFPDDIFYDWHTGAPVRGKGANITLTDIGITDIPIHIRGGSIIPVRSSGANTTTELRKQGFQLVIAPGLDGKASGSLYLDDGDSIEQKSTLEVNFEYHRGRLHVKGRFGAYADTVVESVVLLGQKSHSGKLAGQHVPDMQYDSDRQSMTVKTHLALNKPSTVTFK